jgi:hypoxanthine phosphoribosyltransferase
MGVLLLEQEKINKRIYTWKEYENDIIRIVDEIKKRKWNLNAVYGIPKGGLPIAVALANHLNLRLVLDEDNLKYYEQSQMLIIDDVSDDGRTLIGIRDICNMKSITLFVKEGTRFIPDFYCHTCKKDEWIVFLPWEPIDKKEVRDTK